LKTHTKIYFKHFGLDKTDFIGCEVCGSVAVDIHHLDSKGMGGSKTKDYIENLIAVCRGCHNNCHDSKDFNNKAKEIHLTKL
jgi:hypothetical protein